MVECLPDLFYPEYIESPVILMTIKDSDEEDNIVSERRSYRKIKPVSKQVPRSKAIKKSRVVTSREKL